MLRQLRDEDAKHAMDIYCCTALAKTYISCYRADGWSSGHILVVCRGGLTGRQLIMNAAQLRFGNLVSSTEGTRPAVVSSQRRRTVIAQDASRGYLISHRRLAVLFVARQIGNENCRPSTGTSVGHSIGA